MALLPDVFNPSDIEDDILLKDGMYVMEISQSEMKDTQAGTGKYLSLTMKVTQAEDESRKGTCIFVNLNLVNPNEMAVRIANQEFKSLCEALGLTEVEESGELHGIPFCAKVATKKEKGDWPASNYIKKYFPESEFAKSMPDVDYNEGGSKKDKPF